MFDLHFISTRYLQSSNRSPRHTLTYLAYISPPKSSNKLGGKTESKKCAAFSHNFLFWSFNLPLTTNWELIVCAQKTLLYSLLVQRKVDWSECHI